MARRRSSTSNLLDDIHGYDLNEKNRVIYVHAEYTEEESGVDFRMATKFVKNLDYLNSISNDPITIKLASYGGCWNYGMMMFDAIKSSTSEITVESYAHARSMSSIIPQAAMYRYISKHCDFMVHYGTYGDEGDHRQVLNGILHSERSNPVMLNIYTDRCINGRFATEKGLSRSKLYRFIKDKIDRKVDWWMTAEEAVYYGFMDGIL